MNTGLHIAGTGGMVWKGGFQSRGRFFFKERRDMNVQAEMLALLTGRPPTDRCKNVHRPQTTKGKISTRVWGGAKEKEREKRNSRKGERRKNKLKCEDGRT